MKITRAQLEAQIDRIPKAVMTKLTALAYNDPVWTLPELLAVSSRETNALNIEGDGGHGKGAYQIDNRSHARWLSERVGCKSGTNQPIKGHYAIERGYVPTWGAGAAKALTILNSNLTYARSRVPEGHRKATALAAYNCGAGAAVASFRRYGQPDAYTTGDDYSRDVLLRAKVIAEILAERD